MENISGDKLKKGLSKIKKDVNSKIGPVWKLKKSEVITKIKSLNYKLNNNNELVTDSMIRKPRRIKL